MEVWFKVLDKFWKSNPGALEDTAGAEDVALAP